MLAGEAVAERHSPRSFFHLLSALISLSLSDFTWPYKCRWRREKSHKRIGLFGCLIPDIRGIAAIAAINDSVLLFSMVAIGGNWLFGGYLRHYVYILHDAMVFDAARLKTYDMEYAFYNYHSSNIIRRIILECPTFAPTLWKKALEGKCKLSVQGCMQPWI